jgi:DNA-binding NtrC family response regulator
MLVNHFLDTFRGKSSRLIRGITPEALEMMKSFAWPGNVRELKNFIERWVVLGTSEFIQKQDMTSAGIVEAPPSEATPAKTLEEVEKEHIARVIKECGGRKGEAAALLGIDRKTLFRKMQAFGL